MRVLLTGAAGRIGSAFYAATHDQFSFRLADVAERVREMPLAPDHDAVILDITDLEACRRACVGIDAIVHLAADPKPDAPEESTTLHNFVGTGNVFQAAMEAGVQRMVFASSIWAVAALIEPGSAIEPDGEPRTVNLYGASKVFGEGLCRWFGHSAPGRCGVAVRIGAYDAEWWHQPGVTEKDVASWVSPRDLNDLLLRCLTQDVGRFAIVNGISNNRRLTLGLERTRALTGYQPQDDGYVVLGFNDATGVTD